MNKHYVILEDGTKATRNSENHVYTYAVALSPQDKDVALEQLNEELEDINAQIGYEGESTYLMTRRARVVNSIRAIAVKGYHGKWGVVTWCSRLDLAEKQLRQWENGIARRPHLKGHTVKIVKVERVGA